MKSVFGFRVRLGNPDLDFENLNPDYPIERTLSIIIICSLLPGVNCVPDKSKLDRKTQIFLNGKLALLYSV